MIEQIYTIDGRGTDPYENLGLEEYLLYDVGAAECILYLWQNEKTVVIGKNQNAWKECRCELLEASGGHLARRLSGGGAVFHDLGNLNFTFLVRRENFDVTRQTEVILRAVKRLGIDAERTGRNDITVEGRKFSGNAFYETDKSAYHHGTILLNVDTAGMAEYLTVSKEKLKSKSVDSVKSRVANLVEFAPDITVSQMKHCLKESFYEVYGLPAVPYPAERIDEAQVLKRAERMASWEWKYGRKIAFSDEADRRFYWGEVSVQAAIEKGRIKEMAIWSDTLDSGFTGRLAAALEGAKWRMAEVSSIVETMECRTELQVEMRRDIGTLLVEMIGGNEFGRI